MKTLIVNQKYLVLILTILLVTFGTHRSYAQTITASTPQPLTEATLHGSMITLTLSGGTYEGWIRGGTVSVSGIEGVTFDSWDVDRVSDTELTVELTFSGDFDRNATLTFAVGAGAIAGGYNGPALTAQVPVTAMQESLVASMETPLTEANLHGSIVTLTLTGRRFTDRSWDIENALTISGIDGIGVGRFDGVKRISDTVVTVELTFSGNFDTNATLIFTVAAGAIAGGYDGPALTVEVPVTAVQESLEASTELPLTESTLHGSVVTLTLSGRRFTDRSRDIANALTISGIDGVFNSVKRVSDTVVTISLTFSGNFDTNATLTYTLGTGAIAGGYDGPALTAEVPVTAVQESLEASTESPLTEATLHGSVVTLTLSGQRFADRSRNIEDALTISGIDGIGVRRFDSVKRVSDTVVTVELGFSGNFDSDATLIFTIGARAIAGGYNGPPLTAEIPVTAVQVALVASTEFPLTEATLLPQSHTIFASSGGISTVTLTLTGRRFVEHRWEIQEALKVSGIDGVTFEPWDVERVSDTEVTVPLTFNGDFDSDAILTLTIGAEAIAGYNKAFTVQVPVTAVEQSDATVSVSPSPVLSPAIGEQLTLSLNIANGKNVVGYQAIVLFDGSTLDYVKSTNGDYLPADAFFGDPIIVHDWLGDTFFGDYMGSGKVILAATTSGGTANGDGTLATLTFEVLDYKASRVTLSQVYLIDSDGKRWETTIESGEVIEPPAPAEAILGDINSDGVVNIQDLVIISARFGQTGQNSADLNGDGLVDIVDLVLVANAFGADAAAPSLNPQVLEQLTTADIKEWLNQTGQMSLTDPAYLRGITVLEQLLMALTPKETALLPNYPNPFNPETWIPYHLAKDADVTLHIYAMNGILVRTLTLGHQSAGMYQNRSRAAYWDGKNVFGEPVASGVYFYTLTAGDFSATRKMLIRK